MDRAKSLSIFTTEDDCVRYLEQVRWQGKPTCPYCNVQKATPMKDGRYHCNRCGVAFSVTVRTIFHATRLPLHKWFVAIRLIITSGGKISVRQLAKDANINRNTACQLLNKVYAAMASTEERQLLLSIVEMQE
jgi:transposase-like protein